MGRDWEAIQRLRLQLVHSSLAKKMTQHCTEVSALVKKTPVEPGHCGQMLKAMMAAVPMSYKDMERHLQSSPTCNGRMYHMIRKREVIESGDNMKTAHRIADILLSLKVAERDVYEWLLACGFWPKKLPITVWRSVWALEPELRQGFLAMAKMPVSVQRDCAKDIAVELERSAWRRAVRS